MKRFSNRGFTLIELMVTIAIVGIVSAIAIPNMIGWRTERQLRGAANNLLSDLQLARIRAIREAETVTALFNAPNSYIVFLDNNSNDLLDAGDQELRRVTMPTSVIISSASFFPGGVSRVTYDAKGMPSGNGTVAFDSSAGTISVIVNSVGRLRITP